MKNFQKHYLRKTFALVMAFLMIITMMPVNVFAEEPQIPGIATRGVDSEGKPGVNWEFKPGEKDDGASYWPLKSGARIIHGYDTNDPLNTFGFTYLGKYFDHEGRIVLRLEISHRQSVTTAAWKKYVMRFPKELYQGIDLERSYVLWKRTEVFAPNFYDKLGKSDILGQQDYTYQFPFRDFDTQYGHREVNLVLKKTDDNGKVIDWDAIFSQNQQVIQLRLYDKNGDRIYSTSSKRNKSGLAQLGYNSYTKVAMVGDLSRRPGDLMEATFNSFTGDTFNDSYHTADSSMELDKENKKVKILYTFAKAKVSEKSGEINGEGVALRQSFDPDFIRYLDLSDKNAVIGSMQLFFSNGKPYGNKIQIHAYDIIGVKKDAQGNIELDNTGNPTFTRDDKSVFIQMNTDEYEDKDNPDQSDPNYIKPAAVGNTNVYFKSDTTECASVLFEYDIDPELINRDLIKDKEYNKNFMFDTRYIMSNKKGVYKYTINAPDDIVFNPDREVFFRFSFSPDANIGTGVVVDKDEDFVLNIGGKNGIWKSWKREGSVWIHGTKEYLISPYAKEFHLSDHDIKVGETIKKGTPITVYLPTKFNANSVKFDIVTAQQYRLKKSQVKNPVSQMGGAKLTLDKVKKADGSDIFYTPMYIKNSVSTIGASAIRELYMPIVDEIFTDSKTFTGILKESGGVESLYYNTENSKQVKYLGSNWLDADIEVNKDGKVTKETYERADGKDDSAEIAIDKALGKRTFDNKEYEGYEFEIKKQYTGGDILKDTTTESNVESLTLERDQPIQFSTFKYTSLKSDPVIEQVQTRVKFDLNGQTSKENRPVIEKIAPLSNQYRYNYLTGDVNQNYKPSGFAGENVKYADENKKTIDITEQIDGKDVTRTYQNIANHDGLGYDLKDKDQKEAFLKRQMPTKDEINVPQGKRILGWTTTKLTDIAGGKTAIEQFNELKDKNKIVKYVADWAKVDANENYIFDSKSPIDKERTVYAVYGDGINIVLHSNNTTDLKDETTITIPITVSDIDNTNNIIDSVSSATLSNMKGNLVIKELPKVPVTGEDSEIAKITDTKAKLFNKPNHSFLGWTLYRFDNDPQKSELIAGQNNERIGKLINGVVENGTKRIPKRTEWIKDITGNANKYTRYIPNTFSLALRSQDVPSQDDNQGTGKYNIFLDAIDEGKDLHLYANYRPFFDVKVYPSYKNIDKNQGQYGKYVDNVEAAKKHSVNVGLLHRTAVTNYGTPTVHQNANYYPLEGGKASLKSWDGKSKTPLTWKLPGFDELGQRKSYVSLIVTDDKKDAYENFQSPDWDNLGAKTYIRLQDATATQDPNAPKNLHENAGNPYGDPVAKDQAFTVGVDAFTSATSRKALETTGDDKEVIGYEIWNTSTPLEVLKPVFDNVYDDETEAKLHWTEAEKKADIKKIVLKVANGSETILVKQKDGSYSDGTITARPNGDKLVLSPLNLTGKAGQDIVAKYVVEKNGQEVTGPEGRITINKRGISAPVEDMKQIHNDADGKSKIEFTVPDPVLNKPTKGTTYTAQKWDDTQNKWVDVGKVTLDSDNDKGTQKEITLDDTVKDGDIIRIKSVQPGLNPSDSTGTGDDPYTPATGDENRKYVKLDRAAPITDAKAEDEAFRRFIDLRGTINEIPDGRKVKIIINYKDGTPAIEILKEITVENKENVIKDLNTTLRKGIEEGNIPEIKIIASDRFGNSETKKVDYTESYQLEVILSGVRAGKKFIKVSADRANAEVTVKVMRNGQEAETKTITLDEAKKFERITFDSKLESGDILVVSGIVREGTKNYTTNPYEKLVK